MTCWFWASAASERGSPVGCGLRAASPRPLGVDFNPESVRLAREAGFDAIMGDAHDPEFLAHLPLGSFSAVVSATPRITGALTEADGHAAATAALREAGFRGMIAVTVDDPAHAGRYRQIGADLVLSPFDDAAEVSVARLLAQLRRGDDAAASGGAT